MIITNTVDITNSLQLLRAYSYNDTKTEYKLILGIAFNKSKTATKKRSKIEDNYISELSKDTINLPHTFGKAPSIALFTLKKIENSDGIDYIGADDLIKKIQNGNIIPNYLIAYKDEMSILNKYSRILGPKGLMPTPKQNTIAEEDTLFKIIQNLKKGSLKIKVNKFLMVQIPIGMLSMDNQQILNNVDCIFSHINKTLPSTFLKTNIKCFYLTTTQGPSSILNT